jgi:hypothetical protein
VSWDWDPFRHTEFGRTANDEVVIYCHNCGMEDNIGPVEEMLVSELIDKWLQHVRRSHRMTPEDTRTYSAPGKRFVPGPPLDTHIIKLDGDRTEVWGHYA